MPVGSPSSDSGFSLRSEPIQGGENPRFDRDLLAAMKRKRLRAAPLSVPLSLLAMIWSRRRIALCTLVVAAVIISAAAVWWARNASVAVAPESASPIPEIVPLPAEAEESPRAEPRSDVGPPSEVGARPSGPSSPSPEIASLDPTSSLSVTVRRPNGSPVSGVEIRVAASMFLGDGSSPRWSATTDDEGHCEFGAVPSTPNLSVDVYRDGRLLRAGPRYYEGRTPGERRAVDIVLESGVRLIGRLRDQRGRPLGGVPIGIGPGIEYPSVSSAEWRSENAIAQQAITRADGSFTFADVQPGHWLIGPLVEKKDPENDLTPSATNVKIPAGPSEVEVSIVAYKGLSITGRVVRPDGSPAADVLVFGGGDYPLRRGRSLHAEARRAGVFRVEQLPGLDAGARAARRCAGDVASRARRDPERDDRGCAQRQAGSRVDPHPQSHGGRVEHREQCPEQCISSHGHSG